MNNKKDEYFIKVCKDVTLKTDDGNDLTLFELLENFPVIHFTDINNRLFKLMVCYTQNTFERELLTISRASWRMLKPIVQWHNKYIKKTKTKEK